MSDKSLGAANQQATRQMWRGASETTRRAPLSKKEIQAYLLGALHDGSLNKKKRFRITQKGKEWLKILKALLKQIGYNSWIYKEGRERKVYALETLANFLDFEFNPLKLRKSGERIGYIRGFFDAEGGIPKKAKDRFYIQLVQNDKDKLEKLKSLLNGLEMETGKIHNPSKKVDPEYWRMYVLANSQMDFVKQIGSFHPRKIKILEKRMKI